MTDSGPDIFWRNEGTAEVNDQCTVLGVPVLRFEGKLLVAQKPAPDGAALAFACSRSSVCPGFRVGQWSDIAGRWSGTF